jgi:excisionase family DNA binding protein
VPEALTGKYASISPADRRLVSLNACADMLGISRSGAHLLVQAGELEAVRIGRRLLITVTSVDAYIERLRADAS